MSNPSRRNALTGHMMVRLAEVVDELEKWQAGKALILHGDAGTFVSGGDLSVLKEIHTPGEGEQMCYFMHKTFARLQRLPLISLAAIQGLAIGGGAEVALSCDYRLLSRTAEIKFVQARMGLTPGWGGGARLVQLVGRQKAMEILLQCKSMKLEESLMCGLVDGELPNDKDLVTSCTDWLAPYLRCSTSVIRAVKGVVSAGDSFQLDQALHVERSIFSTMWAGEAHDEALSKKIKHK
ncbi:predicted protein [Nematostella vectensis]|uniref:Ethylmalonyl-CoA decarboxylase n=2 Tax=Nematostella vectensis TaxID=45351 RepID=A7SJU2_NEMVE|nr:predicted protein [Nematostella vectensis]|eukprot:XP_001628062.1 predicted protein [Nematostella vectensis]